MRTIFGYTPEQIARMGKTTHDVDPEYRLSPINPNDGPLDLCIRGGEKILKDSQKKEMFRRIYRGSKK